MNVSQTTASPSQLNSLNTQAEPKQSKPDYFSIGRGILGGVSGLSALAFGINGIKTAAEVLAKMRLNAYPEGFQNTLASCEWNNVSKHAGLALGLFTLSSVACFGPALLKRIQEIKNQNIGNEEKSTELKPEEEIAITELISNYAKALFALSMGISTLDHLGSGIFDYTYAGLSYLFNNCQGPLLERRFINGVEMQFEACQSNMASGKVHLLAGAILLAIAATPYLAKKAKDLLTTQEKQ